MKKTKRALGMQLVLFLLCAAVVFPQAAAIADAGAHMPGINFNTPPLLAPYIADAPEITSQAAVLIDAETGVVLYAKNPGEEIPPASLTKLMTMHLVLREVNAGRVSLNDMVPVTEESWALRQPPRSSLMFLAPGQTVTLREIMLGLAIPSGNDAAIAAALYIAPTVSEFAALMTAEARRMGLTRTRFVEPSGLSEHNVITAAEFTIFCREYLRMYPWALSEFHSVMEFAYPTARNVGPAYRDRPGTIVQINRNSLLRTFPGVDGLKTGYIDESGYNIALTARRNGLEEDTDTRFIAVILGAPARPGGDRIRDRDGERLLSWAFGNFKTVRPGPVALEPVRLWKGAAKSAHLYIEDTEGFANPLMFTAPLDRAGGDTSLWFTAEIEFPLIAPLPAAYPAGWLIMSDEAGELHRVRLVTAQAYPQGNIFRRIWDSIRLFFLKK